LRSALIAELRFCGVTPALARILPASLSFSSASASSRRSTVTKLLAGLLGGVEHPRQSRIEIDLTGALPADLRALVERGLDVAQRLARIAAGTVDQARRQSFRIVEQNLEQMVG
jgi:hypothetical protein